MTDPAQAGKQPSKLEDVELDAAVGGASMEPCVKTFRPPGAIVPCVKTLIPCVKTFQP